VVALRDGRAWLKTSRRSDRVTPWHLPLESPADRDALGRDLGQAGADFPQPERGGRIAGGGRGLRQRGRDQ